MATQIQQEWHHQGSDCCSPFSTCLLAWCVPCVLYGRTHHRLRKDPQLKGWSIFNGDCAGYYALGCCGFSWILPMMSRGDMRAKYGLKGDGCTDCICSCFCAPCDLMQQDKEAEYREGLLGHGAVQTIQDELKKEQGMQYSQQGQQQQVPHQQPQQYLQQGAPQYQQQPPQQLQQPFKN